MFHTGEGEGALGMFGIGQDGVFYLFGGTDGAARQRDVHACPLCHFLSYTPFICHSYRLPTLCCTMLLCHEQVMREEVQEFVSVQVQCGDQPLAGDSGWRSSATSTQRRTGRAGWVARRQLELPSFPFSEIPPPGCGLVWGCVVFWWLHQEGLQLQPVFSQMSHD